MAHDTHPPLTSRPIHIHEPVQAGAPPPSHAPRREACALPTVTRVEPRGGAARPGLKSTTATDGVLLAGMSNPADAPNADGRIYIDERELARRTTLSPRTLQLMRRKGGGPPWAKLGHRVVYKWADVERWIADRTQTRAAS